MLTIEQIEEACNKGEDIDVIIQYNPRKTRYYVVAFPEVKQPDGSWVKGVGYTEDKSSAPKYIRINGQLEKFSLL